MIDIALIEECRKGNLSNFRQLVEATSPFAFSLAFRMLGDEETAKEVVQDTMVTIWQKLKSIKSSHGYQKWVFRIVLNKCYDHLRIRKRNMEIRADDRTWALLSEKLAAGASSALENEEIARIIGLLTAKLSPRQKTIFLLSELEDLTSDEIADITGLRKQVIKSNLYHARKSISGMLEKYLK